MILIKKKDVFIAHYPESNMNLASGIAPIRKYLTEGLKVGLATDVAGGSSLSMFRAMAVAVQGSRMYWRFIDRQFLGKIGSFLTGYDFDAVIFNSSKIKSIRRLI